MKFSFHRDGKTVSVSLRLRPVETMELAPVVSRLYEAGYYVPEKDLDTMREALAILTEECLDRISEDQLTRFNECFDRWRELPF